MQAPAWGWKQGAGLERVGLGGAGGVGFGELVGLGTGGLKGCQCLGALSIENSVCAVSGSPCFSSFPFFNLLCFAVL